MKRNLWVVGTLVMLATAPESAVAKPVCGEVPGELAAVATVLVDADAQCPCASALTSGTYVRCIKGMVAQALTGGTLPVHCKKNVMRAAKRSTCGRPAGSVTCCTINATGKQKCSVKSASEKCKAPEGGTASVGATTSCFDACLPPLSERAFTDAELDAALDIAGQGVTDGWETEFPLVMRRFLAELRARGESVGADAPLASSQFVSAPECRPECYGDSDCLGDGMHGVKYCGWGNSRKVPLLRVEAPSPELNQECFKHDMCYFESCVTFKTSLLSPDCTYSPQTAGCDAPLFEVCDQLAPCTDCGPNPPPAPPSVNNWDVGDRREARKSRHEVVVRDSGLT